MNDLNQLLDQLQQARTRYQRAKEALTDSGKARAFRLLAESAKRHPEWKVKRIGAPLPDKVVRDALSDLAEQAQKLDMGY